jgi:hypothetical protein
VPRFFYAMRPPRRSRPALAHVQLGPSSCRRPEKRNNHKTYSCLHPVFILSSSCLHPAYILSSSCLRPVSQNPKKTGGKCDFQTAKKKWRSYQQDTHRLLPASCLGRLSAHMPDASREAERRFAHQPRLRLVAAALQRVAATPFLSTTCGKRPSAHQKRERRRRCAKRLHAYYTRAKKASRFP